MTLVKRQHKCDRDRERERGSEVRCGAPSRALKATPLKSSARSDALRRVACNTPEAARQQGSDAKPPKLAS